MLCNIFLIFFLTECVYGTTLTLWQTAQREALQCESVNMTCHFTVEPPVILVKLAWLKNNRTEMGVKSYNISAMKYKSSIRNISHTLNLISVGRNHSGTYYCTGWTEIPVLGPKIYGTGTELIVEELPSSCSVDANVTIPTSQYTLLMSLLSFLLITVSITSVTCIMCKGRRRTPNKTKHPKQMCDLEAVQTGVGLPLSVSSDVLYAALTPPRAPETIRTHMISPDPANTDVLYSTIHITPKIMEQMVIPDTPDGV